MPYIKQERRIVYDPYISTIVSNLGVTEEYLAAEDPLAQAIKDNAAKGELNYIIYKIVKTYLDRNGIKYHRLNDFVGVLECCKQELYDRIARNYENQAIEINGDI